MMTLAAVFAAMATCVAEPVSPSAARNAAAAFLRGKGITLNEAVRAPRRAMGSAAVEASPYYVFNVSASQGFVVVSGDDCVGENLVLGYSDRGSFDAEDVPANMQWWLDQMASQITLLSKSGAKAPAVTLHDDVTPLLTCHWHQGENTYDPQNPYNCDCPETDGQLCLTGCMATALSQVLYYHRWPQGPIQGDLPAYVMADGRAIEGLPATTFDWDQMVDDYTQPTTAEQQRAVAKLMRYCGQLVQMDYTPTFSGGRAYDVDLLVNLFGYDAGVYTAAAENYTVSGWDNLLYNELKEGRPLVYMGFTNGSGHAFVVDGYEVKAGSGLFHVNWGWGGLADGLYKISLLNPDVSGAGGSTTADIYNQREEALIGLQPQSGTTGNYGRYLNSIMWNNRDGQYGLDHLFITLNSSYKPGTFDIALAECNDEGMADYSRLFGMKSYEVAGFSYAAYKNVQNPDNPTDMKDVFFMFTLPEGITESLTPGSHRLMFVNRETGTGAEWRPLFGNNRYVEFVIGDDGMPQDTLFHPLPLLTGSAQDLKVEGLMQAGLSLDVMATVSNNSNDDFIGTVVCSTYSVRNNTLQARAKHTSTGIMIEGNSTVDVSFALATAEAGQNVVIVTLDDDDLSGLTLEDIEHAQGYIAHQSINIDELAFWCLDVAYDERTDDKGQPASYIDVTVKNGTPLDYNPMMLAKLKKLNDRGDYDPFEFPQTDFIAAPLNVNSNMEKSTSFILPQPLEAGEYLIDMLITSDFHTDKLAYFFIFAQVPFQVSNATAVKGIEDMMSSDAEPSGEWYDLNGRKLGKRPTAKGVYIYEGKKVMV